MKTVTVLSGPRWACEHYVCFDVSANAEVQKNALALINAMFQRADLDRRKVTFEHYALHVADFCQKI